MNDTKQRIMDIFAEWRSDHPQLFGINMQVFGYESIIKLEMSGFGNLYAMQLLSLTEARSLSPSSFNAIFEKLLLKLKNEFQKRYKRYKDGDYRQLECDYLTNDCFTTAYYMPFKAPLIESSIFDFYRVAKKVIFSGPATIILWDDKTKTVVKAPWKVDGDIGKTFGIETAILKKWSEKSKDAHTIYGICCADYGTELIRMMAEKVYGKAKLKTLLKEYLEEDK